MNTILESSTLTKKPLLMTYKLLRKTLIPYCKGKKPLLDMINDIWNVGVPQPTGYNGQIVKMIYPQHLEGFARLCLKENG